MNSRTNITSAADNNIKNKYNEEAVHQMYLTGITLFDGVLHRLIYKSFVTTAHRAGGLLFGLILYVPSTIFQLNRDGSSWVEPVLS